MEMLVLGSTGRTGARVVTTLQAAGHDVRTIGRIEADGGGTLRAAIDGCDAVISAVGPRPHEDPDGVTRLLETTLEAMGDCGVDRIVWTASGVVRRQGDRMTLGGRLLRSMMALSTGRDAVAKAKQLALLEQSGAAWTFARPLILTDGPGSGCTPFDGPLSFLTRTRRDDLAAFLVDAVVGDDLVSAAPIIASARRPRDREESSDARRRSPRP